MTVDQELQAALDVEPSPEFVARVRTRIASEPVPRTWNFWWLVPAAALAAAIVVAVVLVLRPASVASPQTVSMPAPPPASIAVSSGTQAPMAPSGPTDVRARPARRARPATVRAANDLFVIDAAEVKALRRLVFGPPLNIGTPYLGTTLAAIEIAPISIEPLPIGSEGVRQ